MRSRAVLALAAALAVGGCGGGPTGNHANRCPKPIAYDKAMLEEIQAALEKLPPDNILHQVMADYENERDDLRFCR